MFGLTDPTVKHFNLPAAAHLIPMHQYHTLLTILGLLETVIFITDFSFQKCIALFYIVFSSSVCFNLNIYSYMLIYNDIRSFSSFTNSELFQVSTVITLRNASHPQTYLTPLSLSHPSNHSYLASRAGLISSLCPDGNLLHTVFASPRPLYRVPLPDKLGCYSAGPKETLVLPKEG